VTVLEVSAPDERGVYTILTQVEPGVRK
jgi:hypothetical protein